VWPTREGNDDRVREIAAVTISSGDADCRCSAFQRMAAVMRVRPHHHGVPSSTRSDIK